MDFIKNLAAFRASGLRGRTLSRSSDNPRRKATDACTLILTNRSSSAYAAKIHSSTKAFSQALKVQEIPRWCGMTDDRQHDRESNLSASKFRRAEPRVLPGGANATFGCSVRAGAANSEATPGTGVCPERASGGWRLNC
jgi:hypothetical protein